MTKVLIIGGGGMVGQKLAHRLGADGLHDGAPVELTLFDMGFARAGAPAAHRITGNLTDLNASFDTPSNITYLHSTRSPFAVWTHQRFSASSKTSFSTGVEKRICSRKPKRSATWFA